MAEMDQGGQQSIDALEPVLGACSDPATAGTRGEPVMVLRPPSRLYLGDQALNHGAGELMTATDPGARPAVLYGPGGPGNLGGRPPNSGCTRHCVTPGRARASGSSPIG